MPLLDRETLVDRPVLVNRGDEDEDGGSEDTEDTQKLALGEGGGPEVRNIEFQPGDYDIVAAANGVAVLATGDEEGQLFTEAFHNAAIQLFDLKNYDEDFSDLTRFAVENNIADTGLTDDQIEGLKPDTSSSESNVEQIDSEQDDEDEEDSDKLDTEIEVSTNTSDVEAEIDEIKDEEDTSEEAEDTNEEEDTEE